jgi:hypothetical protein
MDITLDEALKGRYQRHTMFGVKGNVHVILNQRLSHSFVYFALSGLNLCFYPFSMDFAHRWLILPFQGLMCAHFQYDIYITF